LPVEKAKSRIKVGQILLRNLMSKLRVRPKLAWVMPKFPLVVGPQEILCWNAKTKRPTNYPYDHGRGEFFGKYQNFEQSICKNVLVFEHLEYFSHL